MFGFSADILRTTTTTTRTLRRGISTARWEQLAAGGAAARVGDLTFVDECRAQYVSSGWCHVPRFVGAATCGEMRAEARALLESDAAFASSDDHTVYQEEPDQQLPPSHPRNRLMQSTKRIVDYARVPQSSTLREMYGAPQLRSFVEAVVGVPTLHLSACPFNAAMYNGYYDADGLGWHFDRSEFGVNLVLQEPSAGGVFEYHRLTRSEDDLWAYDAVERVIGGDGAMAVDELAAGSLVFFAGRLSLHRVSPVRGATPRINAILTYEKQPDQLANPYSLQKFFGRTADEQQRHLAQ